MEFPSSTLERKHVLLRTAIFGLVRRAIDNFRQILCYASKIRCGACGFMRQLTARILLVLSLVGVLAPAAMALAAPPSHACCMRKGMGMHEHGSSQPQVSSINCCERSCCRPLTVTHFAELRPGIQVHAASSSFVRQHDGGLSRSLLIDLAPHSGRAPPTSTSS